MNNRVIHFEIPADDPERAIRFYAAMFGWDISRPDDSQDYWLAKTGAEGQHGINGAFIKRSEITTVVNTVAVENLAVLLARVRECGGDVIEELTISSVGKFAYCHDTEGNLFGMLEREPELRKARL